MTVRPRSRLYVIYNPTAGWNGRRRLRRVLQILDTFGCAVTIRETAGRGDAEALARRAADEACDAIVVAGGDGTINDVINGLTAGAPPIGIVPLGTANVLAAEIGLAQDPLTIARAITMGTPIPAFAGIANHRRFALMAGIGFDARVVEGLNLRLKRTIGKAAYVASALSALRRTRPQRYEIDVDGEPFTAAGVVVVKTRHYGGPYVIVPSARLDQPSLHVALFDSGGPKAIARYAAGLLSNSISNLSDVRILCAKRVAIRGPIGERVQVDGDLHAELPLLATVSERPFRLLR